MLSAPAGECAHSSRNFTYRPVQLCGTTSHKLLTLGRPGAGSADGLITTQNDETNGEDGSPQGLISSAAFGISPNISGAYIASTRVGGKPNLPTLFRRTVYSMLNLPFGTKR